MASNSEFHLFPKLPVELQLRIWDLFMESEPTVRHEFTNLRDTGNNETSRWYLSVDQDSGCLIDKTVDQREVVAGTIYDKLDLCGFNLVEPQPPKKCWPRQQRVARRTTQETPVSILVNFERDIFFFNCRECVFQRSGGTTAVGVWTMPTYLTSNLLQYPDWILNIRKLALLRPPPEDDFQALTRMKRLKTVYIVMIERYDPWIYNNGFMDSEVYRSGYGRLGGMFGLIESGQEIYDKLVDVFTKCGMEVEIKRVINTCPKRVELQESLQ